HHCTTYSKCSGCPRAYKQTGEQKQCSHDTLLQKYLRDTVEHALGYIHDIHMVCVIGLKWHDNLPGRQGCASQPGEPICRQEQKPSCEHEWECQCGQTPWFNGVNNAEHTDDRNDGTQHHVSPKQRSGRQKCRQGQTYEEGVVAIKPRRQRFFVGAKPLCC